MGGEDIFPGAGMSANVLSVLKGEPMLEEAVTATHTPGPWETGVLYEEAWRDYGHVDAAGEKLVAPKGGCNLCSQGDELMSVRVDRGGIKHVHRVLTRDFRDISSRTAFTEVTNKQAGISRADANLIAAAPELLAAVKALWDAVKFAPVRSPEKHEALRHQVNAAIAKAEGKQ